jgi:3-oxoacyl-[acyl-carrier protein] reductase
VQLQDRVALVTGGGSGLGEAISRRFAAEGATVVVNDLTADRAAAVADTLATNGKPAHAVGADVADSAAVNAMFEEVSERYGRLDVLVNNAGIGHGDQAEMDRFNAQGEAVIDAMMSGQPPPADPWDFTVHITDESWRRLIDVHLSGTFYCIRAALPLMSSGSSIVNMSSVGALLGQPGVPHYSAAKAGILGLTRAIAGEVAPRGIRINAILPGPILTPLADAFSPKLHAMLVNGVPMGRPGQPDEVAATALFLASDESSFMTGQSLSPGGGIHM